MNTKYILLGAIALLLISGWFLMQNRDKGDAGLLDAYEVVETISMNTTFTDPITINADEAYATEGRVELIFNEPVTIDGALGCQSGDMTLVFKQQLTLNDSILCETEDGGAITIVLEGGLEMPKSAQIVAAGSVQIVDGSDVVRTESELAALYDEVEQVPEGGFVIGPLVDDEGADESGAETETVAEEADVSARGASFFDSFFKVAHAQVNNGTTTVNLTGEPIVVSGKIVIKGPVRKGAKRVVVFDFPNTPEVTVQNFELEGPEGRPGDPDSGSCDVKGSDGEDAFRFNAFAPSLKVNNFTLTLGDGGEGGEATTGEDCEDARAKGGEGGKPGNFRMIGSQNFEITGAFIVHPGRGGVGGGATAKGKEGDPGEKGGDANATAGDGGDSKKKLTVMGAVAGTSNVQFGDAVGGQGGSALAEGGKGGDADTCGQNGGPGGKATAKSGDGGDAKLTVSGGAGRMDFANDIGGQGGIVEAYGGEGGKGGSCGPEEKGGDGGKGGEANAKEGKGGQGKNGRASDGAELGDDGGDGGKGGDGCTEGIGGEGGSGGTEDGEKGEDGENLCITITKEEDYVSLLPGEIQVIRHKDYLIPVSNLMTASDPNGKECDGEEHYHPGPNGAINLRGMAVPDPDPNNCGFGKVSEVPIEIVSDPNYVEPEEDQSSGGGMIQIDPPTLVIPAQ